MAKAKSHKKKSGPKPISAFKLFNKSSKLVQDNIGMFAVLYAIPVVGALVNEFANHQSSKSFSHIASSGLNVSPGFTSGGLIGVSIVVALAYFIISIIVSAMSTVFELKLAQGHTADLSALWGFAKKYALRLVGLGIVTGLAIMFGIILLIVPGLIAIRSFILAPYVMIDHDLGVWDSMAKSASLTKPYAGSIWGLIGVGFLIALLGAIPFVGGLISLAVGVLYSVAPALRYQEIKKLSRA